MGTSVSHQRVHSAAKTADTSGLNILLFHVIYLFHLVLCVSCMAAIKAVFPDSTLLFFKAVLV